MKTIRTAGLLALRERKLLLAFSSRKKAFYLPGGKAGYDESSLQALIREVKEELQINLDPAMVSFYRHISAQAFGEEQGLIMEQDCFIASLACEPEAAGEITAIRYFDSAEYAREDCQVPGVIMIMEALKKDRLLD